MYKNFLTKQQLGIFDILKYLNKEPDHSCSYLRLSELIGKDKKTTYSYIEEFIALEKKLGSNHFTFEDGILSEATNSEFHIADLFDYFMKQSIEYQFLYDLLVDDHINYSNFRKKLAVSKSKLSLHCRKIGALLEEYDIILAPKHSKQLQGTESDIRFFYYALFCQQNNITSLNKNKSINEILNIILNLLPNIPLFVLIKIGVYCNIALKRMYHGHILADEDEIVIAEHPILSYNKFKQAIISCTFFDNCLNTEIRERECRHLYAICSFIYLIPIEDLKCVDIDLKDYKDKLVSYIVNFSKLKIPFQLTKKEEEYLHLNLYYMHTFAKHFQGKLHLYGVYDIKHDLELSRPKDMRIINRIMSNLQRSPTINEWFSKNSNVKYMYILIMSEIFMRHKKTLKVFLNTKVSSVQQEMLCNFIGDIAVVPVKFMSVQNILTQNPDCIISDWISIGETKDIPYFNISSQYRNWELTALERFLLKLVDGKFV